MEDLVRVGAAYFGLLMGLYERDMLGHFVCVVGQEEIL